MNDISNMYSMQWREFAPGIVPYRFIVTPVGTDFVRDYLRFREAEWSGSDYVFQDGTLTRGDNELIAIPFLGFSERRIVIQVLGNSDAANTVYAALSEALGQFSAALPQAVPIMVSEETSCAAKLDFEWTALLNPLLVEYVTRQVSGSSTDEAEKAIKGVSVRFTLQVTPGERLREYGVGLYEQTLTVEPQGNTPLSDRRYFTYSPCDSEAHLKLVSELEARLSGRGSRSRRGTSGE